MYGINGIGKTTIFNIIYCFCLGDFLAIKRIRFKEAMFFLSDWKGVSSSTVAIHNGADSLEILIAGGTFILKESEKVRGEKIMLLAATYPLIQASSTYQQLLGVIRKSMGRSYFAGDIPLEKFCEVFIPLIASLPIYYISTQRLRVDKNQIISYFKSLESEDEKRKKRFRKSIVSRLSDRDRITSQHSNYSRTLQQELKGIEDRDAFLSGLSFEDLKTEILSKEITDRARQLLTASRSKEFQTPKKDLFYRLVDEFLEDKRIVDDLREGFIAESFERVRIPLDKLSSGEKNLIVILYDLIFLTNPHTTILIDEPEISMHVGWQIRFADTLLQISKTGRRTFLIATHSPQIVHGRRHLCITASKYSSSEKP
ncbi:MAG: AAA family ATPase [Candidatus Lokiarchaeota archaeon]|nr:AAA family ATPase [Candidatus Lokiarchaeota archaeon]